MCTCSEKPPKVTEIVVPTKDTQSLKGDQSASPSPSPKKNSRNSNKMQLPEKKKASRSSFSQESAIFTSSSDLDKIKSEVKKEAIPRGRVIPDDTAKKCPFFKISNLVGDLLDSSKEVKINAQGLEPSSRKDGVCYFWTKENKVKLIFNLIGDKKRSY